MAKSKIRVDRDVSGTQSKIAKGKADRKFKEATGGKQRDSLGEIEGAPIGQIHFAIGDKGPALDRIRFHVDTVLGYTKKKQEILGKLSKAWDAAEAEGIDKKGTKDAMKIAGYDRAAIASYFRSLRATAEAMNLNVQLDAFNESNISREAQIFDQGFKDGALGKSITDGSFPANTAQGQIYAQGWHAGQASIMRIGKTTEKVDEPTDEDPVDDAKGKPALGADDEASRQAAH